MQIKKHNVDAYESQNDGIWHPDGLPLGLAYRGTESSADGALAQIAWFNPFALIPRKAMVEAFTARLPKPLDELQWALPQYGRADTAPTRGNLAIAQQYARPDWLTKGA